MERTEELYKAADVSLAFDATMYAIHLGYTVENGYNLMAYLPEALEFLRGSPDARENADEIEADDFMDGVLHFCSPCTGSQESVKDVIPDVRGNPLYMYWQDYDGRLYSITFDLRRS